MKTVAVRVTEYAHTTINMGFQRLSAMRAENVPTFFTKMLSDIINKRKQIDSGCVASSGDKKTRCLKKFDIRKVGKAQKSAKRR